jgi:cell division protein ZapA
MSNVTISIAGRRYTIACASGEEAHISTLGASIDAKLAELPNLNGQSEARLLLYAALLLADEAHEAANPVARIEAEVADTLERVAIRLETVAQQLESAPGNA